MKKIELLQRTHVSKIGVCEKGSKTSCDDKTAEHLIKSKLAVLAGKTKTDDKDG